ncbi:non-specific lipid transfer protein GPI-anchored 14-like [Aristolochia californica]|uniref:non-specific lipid transfer protein GPI-anchored 14-like n=1 Tax=Aristolochia californica TaxID=171875 RepID=UPI0035D8F19A
MEDDEKECADQLGNMASCIPYVSGSASKPTKQCCNDTVKLRGAKPKCLCVLIKESTDPAMALPVNTTLALKMPATILKLPPDSPDAKIFAEAGTDPTSQPSPSSGSSPSSSSGSGSGSVPAPDKKETPASSDGATLRTALTGAVGVIALLAACILA